jgi:hypothetical protein
MYNHFDSYPSGLGAKLIEQIRTAIQNGTFPDWVSKVEQLQVIDLDGDRKPTPCEITKLAPYTNLSVSQQSVDDWYCLLRGTQGDLAKILNSGFVFYDSLDFVNMGVEYIYVVNIDSCEFEIHYDEATVDRFPFDFLPDAAIFYHQEHQSGLVAN